MPRQNLTTNACTVCRKKRTKCDGLQPCRRCVARGEDCVYEDKMWRTKDHLRSEIGRLRKEVQQCHGLIKALTIGGTAEELKTIQSRMHRGDSPEDIAAWIKSSRSPSGRHQDETSPEQKEQQIVSPVSYHPSTSPETSALGETSSRLYPPAPSDATISLQSSPEDNCFNMAPVIVSPAVSDASNGSVGYASSRPRSIYTQDGRSPMAPRSLRSWMGVPQDTELILRLLCHYFDNCFPSFSFISKERFMWDLDQGTGAYCSSALLHAILGLASQSYNPSSDTGPESCPSSKFLAQANELLSTGKDELSMTNIQATGILALAEANLGNDESAFELATDCARKAVLWMMRMDSERLLTEDPEHREAMATTSCGAFSLVRIVRILTGRLSFQTGPLFMRLTPDNDDSAIDSPVARVERGVALQHQFFSQLEYCPELLRFINTVTEIAHAFCTYHYDDGVTPADLIPAYDKCLQAWTLFINWLQNGGEMNKDVLFAQIWYNYILTVLFSTLIDSSVDLRGGIVPKAVVIQASETIIFLAGVYQEQCGFLSVHPFLPHMVFAATLVQLRQPFNDNIEQQVKTEGRDKRKRTSDPLSPTTRYVGGLSDVSPTGRHPHQRPSQTSPATDLVRPSWKQHVAPATLRQSGLILDIKGEPGDTSPSAAYVWPSKPAPELAAEGTLHLTKMGITNRKAAELAKVLRAKSTFARPTSAPEVTMSGPLPPQWTPGCWGAVDWGQGGGVGAGFGGLGVDNLQDFAAMTGHTGSVLGGVGGMANDVAQEYMIADGSGLIGGQDGLPRGIEDSGASSYGGLYIYPTPLPDGGAFGGYGTGTIAGVGVGAFSGAMTTEEGGRDGSA